jgi:twitching motility two-component system response regulator PilH
MYSGKKILIVDDSKVEREILKEMIQGLDFTILEAENAAEGIQKAEEHGPDLVLMDVVMPGMNGFQATKQMSLNEKLKEIPVIMCTSKNQSTDKIWGQRQGAKAYLVKPINKNELLEEIKKILS